MKQKARCVSLYPLAGARSSGRVQLMLKASHVPRTRQASMYLVGSLGELGTVHGLHVLKVANSLTANERALL
jgi:hypothetical protein